MQAEAEIRVVRSAAGTHLFLADGSRLFDIDDDTARGIEADLARGRLPESISGLLGGLGRRRYISFEPISPPALRSISLNVAQACNMSCGYCYADRGRFGGNASLMGEAVARHAVDQLIDSAPANSDLVIGFMGGEPFVNRSLVHEITAYADNRARKAGHRPRFSLTTNATLLTEADAELLGRYPFSVTVSLDGDAATNDRQRRLPGRQSAYERTINGLRLLTDRHRPRHISIRATVSPLSGALLPLLEHFFSLGVDEAGFAPVLAAPTGFPAFNGASLVEFTAEMIACGEHAKAAISGARRFPFSNFETALQEIHRGTHRPYPCGAGAGYMSVGSKGDYFACHRLVDDAEFRFGDLESGLNETRRSVHLRNMHVDRQEPCKSCWARYLCGGGCYHEVARRGRLGCDYIRAWLEFCLAAYAELSRSAPGYFENPDRHFGQPGAAR
ncbi:SPASM domain-containing protein [Bradyrhizobium sp. 190]|uniref:radical SAM/SPASM domain-containing protein n=1 Tax=Bradyrhizobium sp. 190 TaxID=2782658 RepID=UPI001FF8C68B|nr:radical SAM protein [Bradyrhizobium sp. 190]MCK1516289.1 SPASM domain-containing protein [Bradyrhizobium sp. 190]